MRFLINFSMRKACHLWKMKMILTRNLEQVLNLENEIQKMKTSEKHLTVTL